MVLLQNCMGFVEGETGPCSETCVTSDVDGTEEFSVKVEESICVKEDVSFKVEEAIDMKDGIPEAIIPPIKTEREVRLWGVCEVVAAYTFSLFWPQQGMCEITLNYFLLL